MKLSVKLPIRTRENGVIYLLFSSGGVPKEKPMEHIGEIIKRQIPTSTSRENTGTWSNVDATEIGPVKPECPLCNGVKFVYPLLPSGKPDYSRVVPCRCVQKEAMENRQSQLLRYSNLGSLARLSFTNLKPEGNSDDTAVREKFTQAVNAAKVFAEEPKGWLVFVGPSGSGKTHLGVAIANRCLETNRSVFYISVPDLLDHLRSSFAPSSELPYDDLFQQVRGTPLLILDDFGTQSATSWAKEKLDQLLNHRYANELPTVILSAVPIEELEDRLQTRILNSTFCRIYDIGQRSSALSSSKWAPGFELQKNMTFANFGDRLNLPVEQRHNLSEAVRLAKEFAKSPDGWLVFQGVNGCGKTHLAAAIVNYRYQINKPALFVVVPDFLDHLRSSFSPESKLTYDQLFEAVKNAPLLVLDDFGEQAGTPWAQEKLYQVINHRYNARLPSVITTCCSLDEIESRISSRLVDPKISVLFNIIAPDYRGDIRGQKRLVKPRKIE
jgi:DNA replication protein DnaC